MTTEKHKISAYLSEEDFKLLTDLAAQYRVSKSQLVILAIRNLGENPSSPTGEMTAHSPIIKEILNRLSLLERIVTK